jgi:hypothetical protein
VAEKPVDDATAALRAMSSRLSSAIMDAYALAVGIPTYGLHRKYMDHAVRRFAVPCKSCKESGLQMFGDAQGQCVDCGGFKRRLSPAAVRRLYQIVAARFPEVRARSNAEESAQRWEARKAVTVTKPMYLGLKDLPLGVPQKPDSSALRVASITWRRGLRSEFLWTACEDDICVLWEHLPGLEHAGESWTEVFAWAQGGDCDPKRSAQRLLQDGWSVANPAYDWLGSLTAAASNRLSQAFSVTSEGLLSRSQFQWLFHAAVRVRVQGEKRSQRPKATDKPLNIGPYHFRPKTWTAHHISQRGDRSMELTEAAALRAYAIMINTLSTAPIEPLLADDFVYESQQVINPLKSKQAFLEYMSAKLATIRKTNATVWAELGRVSAYGKHQPCVILAQNTKANLVGAVLATTAGGKLERLDVCIIPDPHTAERSGEYPT